MRKIGELRIGPQVVRDYQIEEDLGSFLRRIDASLQGADLYVDEDVDGEMRSIAGSYDLQTFAQELDALMAKALFPEAVTIRIGGRFGDEDVQLTLVPPGTVTQITWPGWTELPEMLVRELPPPPPPKPKPQAEPAPKPQVVPAPPPKPAPKPAPKPTPAADSAFMGLVRSPWPHLPYVKEGSEYEPCGYYTPGSKYFSGFWFWHEYDPDRGTMQISHPGSRGYEENIEYHTYLIEELREMDIDAYTEWWAESPKEAALLRRWLEELGVAFAPAGTVAPPELFLSRNSYWDRIVLDDLARTNHGAAGKAEVDIWDVTGAETVARRLIWFHALVDLKDAQRIIESLPTTIKVWKASEFIRKMTAAGCVVEKYR